MSYVDWIDHHGDSTQTWRTRSEIVDNSEKDFVIRTYGEVIYEDDEKIIIAAEKRLDEDLWKTLYRYTTTIMKKLVTHIEFRADIHIKDLQ